MAVAQAHMDPAHRHPDQWWAKLAIHRVSPTWFTIAALCSYLILALSVLKGAPNWLSFVWAGIPWVLLLIGAPYIESKPEDRMTFKADNWWSRLALHTVPVTYILAASLASAVILALSLLQALPTWLSFGLALAPWGAIILLELEWIYAHFGWFTLFATMAVVQTIHYSEHCIEIIQYHVFHQTLLQSIAIFSSLNIELVHFSGDSFLTIGTLFLLAKYPRNPFLWICIPFQIAHQAEHTYLTYNYLFAGDAAGGPGLLASPGGAIGGGIGLIRPDLHWIYNTLYTIPFVAALIYQTKHVYDANVKKAFPHLSTQQLISITQNMETLHFAIGQTVLSRGDPSDRLYIISDGSAAVYSRDDSGRDVESATLHAGQYFGEIGLLVPDAPHTKTIRAVTKLTVLCMDKDTFMTIVQSSQDTGADMLALAHQHMARIQAAASTPATVPAVT